jgi:hypothetical protein
MPSLLPQCCGFFELCSQRSLLPQAHVVRGKPKCCGWRRRPNKRR